MAWASEQAELLRAEQIEDVGKSEKRELTSRIAVLITHLLKWKFQPEKRSKSWVVTIDVQRARVADRLRHTPSLKHLLADPI